MQTENSAAARDIFEELLSSVPAVHGYRDDMHRNWQLDPLVLRFLFESLGPGARTFETGCGYSTIVFALIGTHHTAVSPHPVEHERIRQWCSERGISLESVHFVEGQSQSVLPAWSSDAPLDLVLIDGAHKFPLPFLDWFYLSDHLKVDGLAIIDDTHIRTGLILKEFLQAEAGRWSLHREFPTTAVFQKAAQDWFGQWDWSSQPYCAQIIPPHKPMGQRIQDFYRRYPRRWGRSLNRRLFGNVFLR